MQTVKVVLSTGQDVLIKQGTILSTVLQTLGIKMDFPCGGLGKCGQCRVIVAEGNRSKKANFREVLACSYQVTTDLWVEIPGSAEDPGTVILTSGSKAVVLNDAGVKKIFITIRDLEPLEKSYWHSLFRKTEDLGINVEKKLDMMQTFAAIDKKRAKGITLVTFENNLIAIEAGDTRGRCFGLAVDIGTTTVVGYLMDLESGKQLAIKAQLNEQRLFGADVISRISAAQESKQALSELQGLIIGTINSIVDQLTTEAGVSPQEIYSVTLAGNTCMHHLLLGLNPRNLGQAPFLPVYRQELIVKSADLGLAINHSAKVWVFPVVAGFIGGDTVAAILACSLDSAKGNKLLVDIGTNGELVIRTKDRMLACSAAAGPALEGAQIACGMRAEKGAISKVQLLPDLKIDIIGSHKAKGICGSGLVDLLAELLKVKIINQRGKIIAPEKYDGPESLRKRLLKGEKGNYFVLLKEEENEGTSIFITQSDISQLQLAKGALRGAMEELVKKVGLNGRDVDEILLAGAFGNFIDIAKAHAIGLLPDWAVGKVTSIGNAAGEGARIALFSLEKRLAARRVIEYVEFLELAGNLDFEHAFIKGLLF